jgi:hypothetical protein
MWEPEQAKEMKVTEVWGSAYSKAMAAMDG